MTRYFFHVDACGNETTDVEGQALVDMASAMQAAMRLSWQLMAAEVSQGRLCLSCHVIIENGATGDKTIVPFKETLRLSGV